MVYEGGAGRFSKQHKILTKLVKELHLSDALFPMNPPKLYIKDAIAQTDFDEDYYMQKLLIAASQRSPCELKSKTLLMFMRELFKPSEVDDIIYAFGYQSEFEVCSVYHAIKHLKDNLAAKVEHFGMMGGLGRIVTELEKKLRALGVEIATNCSVQDVDPRSMVITHASGVVKADRMILCVTKDKLLNFKTLIAYDKDLDRSLTTIQSRPLYRIYAKFPTNSQKAWFVDVPRICTNNALRQFIPINPSTGLVMLCYCDGLWAETWKHLPLKTLQKELMRHLRLLFPKKEIPNPEWIDPIYWDHAAHYPMPNYKAYTQSHANKYVVCGEVVTSKNNGWIEGALMSSEHGLKALSVSGTTGRL